MSLNFPLNPTTGTTYTTGSSASYVFDGVKWTGVGDPGVITLPVATQTQLGGIKQGSFLSIAGDGTTDADFARSIVSTSTVSLADQSTADISLITGVGTVFNMFKVTVSQPAWVRFYTNEASRAADAGRLQTVDPLPGAGILAEVITTQSDTTVLLSPAIMGYNDEVSPVNALPVSITNISGGATAITVTVSLQNFA